MSHEVRAALLCCVFYKNKKNIINCVSSIYYVLTSLIIIIIIIITTTRALGLESVPRMQILSSPASPPSVGSRHPQPGEQPRRHWAPRRRSPPWAWWTPVTLRRSVAPLAPPSASTLDMQQLSELSVVNNGVGGRLKTSKEKQFIYIQINVACNSVHKTNIYTVFSRWLEWMSDIVIDFSG